jgi:RecB family endonuclease NucS
LQITRSIDEKDFRESMSRRFSILGKGFTVEIGGKPLEAYQPPLQFSFEGSNGGWENVPGVGDVKWWFGFTERPIPTDSARGVSILVRDKMAQAPFFFDLSGGAYGQVGMQYMTGEVYADQLDRERDFVGTDRQGILWTEPLPEALLRWGQVKVREKLREWAELRTRENTKRLEATLTSQDQRVEERIARLQPAEQKEVRAVIRKLASIESVTDQPDRAQELLDLVLRAFEDSSFFALIKALGQADQAEREQVLKLVTELDVFETVKLAEVVRARVEVIRKFQEMIEKNVPEKPDMQDFLFTHPWLIDPEWLVVEHEKSLETLLVDHFKLDRTADADSDKRVDFFCMSSRGRFLIVEVKRPGKAIGKTEVVQIMDYLAYLREQAPGQQGKPNLYQGVLVGHGVSPAGIRWREPAAKDGIEVRTWRELLDVAERIHKEFLAAIKERVPDDARVQSLPPLKDVANDGGTQ